MFVRVDTDEGLYGWGEAALEWKTRAVPGTVQDLAPLVLGRDPRDIGQLARVMDKHGFWRIGVIGKAATSGIEVACWDIFCKSVGLPVWRLLGGRMRDRVRVYTHLGMGQIDAVYETLGRAEARGACAGGAWPRLPGAQGHQHPPTPTSPPLRAR